MSSPIVRAPNSIRWQLQLWFALLLFAVLAGFGVTVYQLQRTRLARELDAQLEQRVAALNRVVRNSPLSRPARPPEAMKGPRRPPPPAPKPGAVVIPEETEALFGPSQEALYYVIWFRDGSELKRSQAAPSGVPAPGHFERDTLTHWRTRNGQREAYHCTGLGDCTLAGQPIAGHEAEMRQLSFSLVGAGAAILALALGIGWWITSHAVRPIEQVIATAVRISEGDLSERIRVDDERNELSRMAAVLNTTFARLEAAFEQQRQFTADAAHELRTPLSVLIIEAQSALARERTAPEYREALEGCLEAAQQMRRLVESMLELARLDSGKHPTARTAVDIADVARRCLEVVRPLAERGGITVDSTLGEALVWSTEERIERVVLNLLTNAIDYNRLGGSVRIATSVAENTATLTVADTGTGIPEGDLPHIFDRFYRTDRSRSSANGKTGLGLAICKRIIEADGGSIEAISTFGDGSTFTVRFPRYSLVAEPR